MKKGGKRMGSGSKPGLSLRGDLYKGTKGANKRAFGKEHKGKGAGRKKGF